ncbi:MAG TPA: hypothetical protein VNJ01_04085 [Bacteriovoracaceae bacterium]|nr:hypothetical protein [Bacteriovoracaceae bacterium]
MKLLLVTGLALLSMSSFAQEDLAAHKAKENENFDKRISRLTEAKTCVNAAATKEAFKSCKEALHKDMQAMKEDWKNHKKEHHKKK